MLRNICVPLTITRKKEFGSTVTYKRLDELGRGGFAAVYKVVNTATGEEYALKAVPKERVEKPKSLEKLKCEISIQRSLNHPNCLRSYDNFEDFKNYYIVLELAPGGSVKDLVRKEGHLSEVETARILREVMSGVCYLHDCRIIHRDLKLENFLIGKDGRIKIADYGLSTKLEFDDERKYTVCGTPNYLSPELLNHSTKSYSYEVDIWTIGVCAFAMLTGKPPFETPRRKLTYELIKNCKYSFPIDIPLSPQAKDFIKQILQIRPEKRPNAQDVALHPFLTQIPRNPVVPKRAPIDADPVQRYPIRAQRDNERISQQPQIKKIPMDLPVQDHHDPLIRANKNNFVDAIPHEKMVLMPRSCVSRFCDHSDKYGLGYMLIDGTVGACFNDYSRMVMDPHETFVQYWENNQSSLPEVMDPRSGTQIKKLALLRRFSESLKKTKSMYEMPSKRYVSSSPLKHVKYWIRNEEAALFRLDDKNIQVNFNDRTKLVIFWNSRKMMIVQSIKDAGRPIPIAQVCAMPSSSDERKRYRVAKSMLAALSAH
ncbi:CAMK family protein kinase [Tritrichomonas foetus]|uniref:Serine/threonine-protein kinase PLK n=1 Tax=Tritrichomonas foetus TaxID=1144522 RepID=A0A1J4KY25_9EUKA|nr:CAMK family protein kinase [Tritrichomonas foetus]|eukprot:OHT14614.1 CAMK family protein kinase [Tritrichomonas foetus]